MNDSCIKMGVVVGHRLIANRGIIQGFVRSTLLFNLFLTDLPSEHRYIIWADDVPLLSETVDGFGLCLKFYRNMWKKTTWK